MGQCSSRLIHVNPSSKVDDSPTNPPTTIQSQNQNREVQVIVCLDQTSEHSINIRIKLNTDGSYHANKKHYKDISFTAVSDHSRTSSKQEGRSLERLPPSFPSNHHRQMSDKIQSRRYAHKRCSSNKSLPLPLEQQQQQHHHLQREISAKSSGSWLNLTAHGDASCYGDSLGDIHHGSSSRSALSLPLPKSKRPTHNKSWMPAFDTSIDDESDSILLVLPPPQQNSKLSSWGGGSMNDVSGNTMPTRVDYNNESQSELLDESHRSSGWQSEPVQPEKKRRVFPSNPPRLLSSVQLRKQKIHEMVDGAIDQYATDDRQGQSSYCVDARSCRSDWASSITRERSANSIARARREPWNPHNVPSF